jgi:hypothetical protein
LLQVGHVVWAPFVRPDARVIGPPVLERRIARVAKRMAKAHAAEGCAPALTFRLR